MSMTTCTEESDLKLHIYFIYIQMKFIYNIVFRSLNFCIMNHLVNEEGIMALINIATIVHMFYSFICNRIQIPSASQSKHICVYL